MALMSLGTLALGAAPAHAFKEPDQIRSHRGVLKATLVAQEGDAMMAGKRVSRTMTYNGKFPGPTLRVHPGDRIELKLVNRMTESTNFHFHGLHVSPAGHADNVLRVMQPGSTSRIVVKIPHDHANGLFWYHPHRHGDVNSQVLRGLAGMISIEGGKEQVRKLEPFKQRLIGLNVTQFDPTGTSVIPSGDQNDATATTTVNGEVGQRIDMRPGQTEMWRIANMSNEGFYKLNLEGHRMWIVGQDGNPTKRAKRVRELIVAPGSRYEVLVKAGKAGSYKFRQLTHSDGFNSFPQQDLLTLKIAGKQARDQAIPHEVKDFEDLSHAHVDVHRHWVLSFGTNPTFTADINGKVFDPKRVDTRARIGSVEEWTFINQTSQDHPMHLHTNDFQVMRVNGHRFHANGVYDNFILPRNGSVTIRFKPETYTGLAVFHCHILFHEDSGMMATIRYVKAGRATSILPRGSTSVHDQAANAASLFEPGSAAASTAAGSALDTAHHGAHAEPVGARGDLVNLSTYDETIWRLCRLAAQSVADHDRRGH
jgi:FtsP/CotA-like multicopper oxidase with cupredoxin domain